MDQNFYVDKVIQKVVRVAFMPISLILLIIDIWLIYIINIKLVLIRYLCCEMVINVFVLLDILSDNRKY